MRRQRIYLRDTGHYRNERRAYRTSGTYQISVVLGVLYKLLRDHVQNREAVFDDSVKLFLQALGDYIRYLVIIAVPVHRPCPAEVLEFLLRALDGRRVCSLGYRTDILNHIGNGVGVGYYDFLRLFCAKIAEFLQHLIGGAQVQRRLVIGVLEALPCLQYLTEYPVLLVHEVDVAGGNHRLVQLLAELDNAHVQLAQSLVVRNHALAHQELVIRDRLYFEIVVYRRYALYLFLRLSVEYRAEKLTRFAGAADYKSLAVFLQFGQRHAGLAVEVVQVGIGNQLVQVL